jgi:hypothetical protein
VENTANFDPATQVFTWTPTFNDAGTYKVTFEVFDNGTPAKSDFEVVDITVTDTPQ